MSSLSAGLFDTSLPFCEGGFIRFDDYLGSEDVRLDLLSELCSLYGLGEFSSWDAKALQYDNESLQVAARLFTVAGLTGLDVQVWAVQGTAHAYLEHDGLLVLSAKGATVVEVETFLRDWTAFQVTRDDWEGSVKSE